MSVSDLFVHQRLDILVEDLLLAISQSFEANECILELIVGKLVAKFFQFVNERMTSGMLAHYQ